MSSVNFMDFMKDLAEELIGSNKTHKDFINTARFLSDAIQQQLVLNNSVYQHLLDKLHTTASYVNNLVLDLPLNFEVFLPIRVPVPVTCRFEEKHRTVQVTRFPSQHPFFFGNALNFKQMNMMLEHDLAEVVEKLTSVTAFGVIYDLSYTVIRRGLVPFLHQLQATERGGELCISFDFVLALVFEGAEAPLPSYYNAPIVGQWLAYGLAGEDRAPTDWSVLVPKWKTASPGVCLRYSSSIIMLYRLLKVQKCELYAQPFALKLTYAMVTEERGEMYQGMSIAEMNLTILFHQVMQDVYQAVCEQISSSGKLLSILKEQIRARGIYYILAYGARKNEISSEFVFAFFAHVYIPAVPSFSKWTLKFHEVATKPMQEFPQERKRAAVPTLKRRMSM